PSFPLTESGKVDGLSRTADRNRAGQGGSFIRPKSSRGQLRGTVSAYGVFSSGPANTLSPFKTFLVLANNVSPRCPRGTRGQIISRLKALASSFPQNEWNIARRRTGYSTRGSWGHCIRWRGARFPRQRAAEYCVPPEKARLQPGGRIMCPHLPAQPKRPGAA